MDPEPGPSVAHCHRRCPRSVGAVRHVRGCDVSKPRYRYAHQQERKRWAPVVAAGEAYCAEVRCLMKSRWIAPGSRWHLAHDSTGTVYVGVSHARCNTSEGASRGNRMRGRKARKPTIVKTPVNRWII